MYKLAKIILGSIGAAGVLLVICIGVAVYDAYNYPRKVFIRNLEIPANDGSIDAPEVLAKQIVSNINSEIERNSSMRSKTVIDPSQIGRSVSIGIGNINYHLVRMIARQYISDLTYEFTGSVTKPNPNEYRIRGIVQEITTGRSYPVSIPSSRASGQMIKEASIEILKTIDPYTAAVYFFRNYDYDQARQLLNRTLSRDHQPDYDWARGLLAQIYIRTGNIDRALIYADRALESNPNHLVAHMFYVDYYVLQDRKQEAKKHIEVVLREIDETKYEHAYRAALLLRPFNEYRKETLEWSRRAIKLAPNRAYGYVTKALIHARQNEKSEALSNIEKAGVRGPGESRVKEIAALIYLKFGENEKAKNILIENLQSGAFSYRTPMWLGIIHQTEERLGEAVLKYRLATDKWPPEARPFALLGRALEMRRDFRLAKDAYAEGLDYLAPPDERADMLKAIERIESRLADRDQ